jgi:hypothetical protein
MSGMDLAKDVVVFAQRPINTLPDNGHGCYCRRGRRFCLLDACGRGRHAIGGLGLERKHSAGRGDHGDADGDIMDQGGGQLGPLIGGVWFSSAMNLHSHSRRYRTA